MNLDSTKGDFVVAQVRDGKFSGSLLGTDVSGTWNGKTLAFAKGKEAFEAHLVSEPDEKGKMKYTLTGTRAVTTYDFTTRAGTPHTVKTGWYAQLTADAPAPTGQLKAEVRGVFVVEGKIAHVSVKRQNGSAVEETRVWVAASADEWKLLKQTPAQLNGKEVVVTGQIALLPKGRDSLIPEGALYLFGKFEIKPADESK